MYTLRISVHSAQFVPYACAVLSIQLVFAKHLRSAALWWLEDYLANVFLIYIYCWNSSHLVVDGLSWGSQVARDVDSPEDLQGKGASTGCRSQLYSAFGITFYQKFRMPIPFGLCGWSITRWGLKWFQGTIPGAPHIWHPILQAGRHGSCPLTGSLH